MIPVRLLENSESAQQRPEEAAAVMALQQQATDSVVHSAHVALLQLALRTCAACKADLTEQLMPVLRMYLRGCQILQERGHPIPPEAVEMFLGSRTIVKLE